MSMGEAKVSHLIFADDLLVFGRKDTATITAFERILSDFKDYTGLVINKEKSLITGNRNGATLHLSNVLGVPMVQLPLSYLGLPLYAGAPRNIYYTALVTKIGNWLNGWSSKLLSSGGRMQMIRSSINGLLVYWCRAIHIPKGIIKKINSLTARFFYHAGESGKTFMISWQNTTLPKIKGGIGLHNLSNLYTISKLKII